MIPQFFHPNPVFSLLRTTRDTRILEIYEKLANFYDPKVLLSKEQIFELHCRDFINRHAISDRAYLKV